MLSPYERIHDLRTSYETDVCDLITSPGKFEGEPIWAPYFWEEEPSFEDLGTNTLFFILTEEERRLFPSLSSAFAVYLWEDDNGFVWTGVCDTPADYHSMIRGELH